ncbi:uncharacterized protein LOC132621786 isoform X2 [Lycium barbarum]|uniref:uncharacterized protein LOC132621786 isoform X2 n=1 Tax=Lycium barbarum TaxID=112863 RepID=UPI00293F3629|nr:uncharacterized protein LOC132621786 isoform X2 [Lycium barbarum]XP_060192178.1 uncharacterized protein LOC132621786 isoform X2 [Lycium barbarum]XP_060192179.1 uncharacterized protein LOC132621786 isoform X2 [Lycium barbarum]XP_060192180.1 uncharacterized protein LOC132621786 isoform X2 [Lycium barbarum]XP_060192181.1 uncharacterized protein LOC132621786 isoform X2 [Lycium barbarum]XP_060192182.1 uncharacterized protein LOC132621786 isoform X2 [Lycium barbarum]XP_060192183.1 uncharacterize
MPSNKTVQHDEDERDPRLMDLLKANLFCFWKRQKEEILCSGAFWHLAHGYLQITWKAAHHLWNTIGAPLGKRHQDVPIRGLLESWWNMKACNKVQSLVFQIAPIMIFWEIWKTWTACRFGEQKKFSLHKMETQAMWNIRTAINIAYPKIYIEGTWLNYCEKIEKLIPVLKVVSVCWARPPNEWMKLNTDGSFCSATDRAGIGGILRNDKGDFIMAFSYSVDCETNNHAEALAAEFGINWCIQQGLNNIILELDSQIIANMLKEKGTDNLKLKYIISRITGLINGNAVQTAHCYREANSVADFFAKLASTSGRRTLHISHMGLPRVAKGLIQLDKQQLPTFRRSSKEKT